jgi:hypothetical protein
MKKILEKFSRTFRHRPGSTDASVMEQCRHLEATNAWQEAIELLTAYNQKTPTRQVEAKLIELRLNAFRSATREAGPSNWKPPIGGAVEPAQGHIPVIEPRQLNCESLANAIFGGGAIIVKGLVSAAKTEQLRNFLDATLVARSNSASGQPKDEDSAWYYRNPAIKGVTAQYNSSNKYDSDTGSCWVADSPHATFELIELYRELGLREMLTEYFQEPPCLSVKKWVMRKIAPIAQETGWHQDGIFLGEETRSVNLWLPLSRCGAGTRSPGMEVVIGDNREIYETGTQGAAFDWTVGPDLVRNLDQDSIVCCPSFEPGDALFFDHYNLHRTAFGPELTLPRYAIESWFFASSLVPDKQVPLFF